MRIVIAMIKHETNTFSPVPTPLERFGRGAKLPAQGEEVTALFGGTGTGVGAFLDLASQERATVVTPVAGHAIPSGPVDDDALDFMTDLLCDAVSSGCDAVLLELHGAMVTHKHEDGDGEILRRLRQVAPTVPVGVSLDMHANLFGSMVKDATVIAGYQTYPHIDIYETGLRAARPIFGMLKGECSPAMSWGNAPMLPHVMRQGTDDSPNRELQQRCLEMERDKVLAASVFTGFPHADVRNAGLSAVVVSDGDRALADRYRDELLDSAWRGREGFVYRLQPLDNAIARARSATAHPIILLDHFDNAASGGTMDTTTVLKAVLDAELENVVAFATHDPKAVQQIISAGEGERITVSLGGKIPMPALGLTPSPIEVSARVWRISDGRYHNEGPAQKGLLMDMGPTAVLDTGRARIVVISRHQEPNDPACLRSLGIEPAECRYLLLKSRVHWRAAFRPLAADVIECTGTGVCTSDYSQLSFQRVRRPIFPLDDALSERGPIVP